MKKHVLDFKSLYINALLGKERVTSGLAYEEKIHPYWFDFNLDSLYYLDSYLISVFVSREELDEKQVENTIWAMGFYLGEVIRQHAEKKYTWKNWDEFFPQQDQKLQETYFQTMGTAALLVAGDNSFILPIDRVIEFVRKGPQNSLHYFASQEIETAEV